MDTIRVLAIFLIGGFGLYLSVINWMILVRGILRKEHHSYTPFLGGGLLAGAILLTPIWPLWWLAFIIDFGSIPWILSYLDVWLLGRVRKSKDQG